MSSAGSFRQDMREELRTRLLDAARDITTSDGWSAVTMGAVAARAGISRQHLYNEIGTKRELGNALVARETDGFIAVIVGQLDAHPDDLEAGATAAVAAVLDHGAQNVLLKAILSADDGRSESLLPLLTATPDVVLERATDALTPRIAGTMGKPADGDTRRFVDALARLIISHATQGTGPIDDAVTQTRWIVLGFLARSQ
ncbi:TetR/AcrR family transcriptional regulator [Pseudonocardia spirodelae]|uniref:TetR family transcriptional regulator n=1 Tax=Pseudonocardia spirodelae TaxID=3133431 RepID=A0ABU8T379_9PSEU